MFYIIIFFCYNCVCYIVVVGIICVVFIEFYDKSFVLDFYCDVIIWEESSKKFFFVYFIGVFFVCYFEIFEFSGVRKDSFGKYIGFLKRGLECNLIYFEVYWDFEKRINSYLIDKGFNYDFESIWFSFCIGIFV